MNRQWSGARLVVPCWLLVVATCVSGVSLVLGLGSVAPVFLEDSLLGITGRFAIAGLCMAVFMGSHWHGRRHARQFPRREGANERGARPSRRGRTLVT